MKKLLAILLCIVMIVAFSATAFAEFDQSIQRSVTSATWHIIGSNIRLRSGPGTEYSIGGLVQNGDKFIDGGLYTGSDGNEWRYCSMTSGSNAGNNGYVAKQYTEFS